jgi:hypothetical protein
MKENFGVPQVSANDHELLAEVEGDSKKYEEYVRLRDEAPAAVHAELELMLGCALETAHPTKVYEAAQQLFDQYAANADGPGNVNRMKAKVAGLIAEKLKPMVVAMQEIEVLKRQFPEIPLPDFANDNHLSVKTAA